MRLSRFRRRQRDFDQGYGAMLAGCFLTSGFLIYIALTQMLHLMPFFFIGVALTFLIERRIGLMRNLVKRITGMRTDIMSLF